MNKVYKLILKLDALFSNTIFVCIKRIQLLLFPGRRMKILFSIKEDSKKMIERGLKFTHHTIKFEDLSVFNVNQSDLVVPLTIADLKFLCEVRHLIKENPIPIPSLESILLCDDKKLLNHALVSYGFGEYIPQMGGPQIYPYILKKSIDNWGVNSHIIWNTEQEKNFTLLLTNPNYFTQQFIPGTVEYATHILFKNQKIAYSLNIKWIFETETPIKGKDNLVSRKICKCQFLDLFTSILKTIKFEGLCCINYKFYNNQLYLIEINPRFGGSLNLYFFTFLSHLGAS